jgi:hypothetical protein
MSKHGRSPSPNDQRSNALNPNNPAYRAAQNNRANTLNPNNPAFQQPGTKGPEADPITSAPPASSEAGKKGGT